MVWDEPDSGQTDKLFRSAALNERKRHPKYRSSGPFVFIGFSSLFDFYVLNDVWLKFFEKKMWAFFVGWANMWQNEDFGLDLFHTWFCSATRQSVLYSRQTAARVGLAVKPRCRGKQGNFPITTYCFTQRSNGCSLGSFLFSASTDSWPAVCKYLQYEEWTQTIRTPFLHQTIRTFEILTSRKLSNQTQPDLACPCA